MLENILIVLRRHQEAPPYCASTVISVSSSTEKRQFFICRNEYKVRAEGLYGLKMVVKVILKEVKMCKIVTRMILKGVRTLAIFLHMFTY